jgi:hypothetical protein
LARFPQETLGGVESYLALREGFKFGGESGLSNISIAQLRAARGLLGWSPQHLADKAHIPLAGLLDYETGARQVPQEASARLRYILEQAGVVFADDETGVSLLPAPKVVPLEKLNSSNDE